METTEKSKTLKKRFEKAKVKRGEELAVAVHGWTDGRKRKLPKGLGVALVLSHVDP